MTAQHQNEPIHALVYGDQGSFKSTFAASFPTRILVHCFDPFGKDAPYLRRGNIVTPYAEWQISEQSSVMYRDVFQDSQHLIRIEYYYDMNIEQPSGFRTFKERQALLMRGEYKEWATIVMDSMTFMELAARKYHQYVIQPSAKDPRKWFGGSTDELEENAIMRMAGLPCNVIMICHISEDKDELHGGFVRNPALPGRLQKRAGAAYSEMYRAFVRPDGNNNMIPTLQTRISAMFAAHSQIDAPNLCAPNYNALWVKPQVS